MNSTARSQLAIVSYFVISLLLLAAVVYSCVKRYNEPLWYCQQLYLRQAEAFLNGKFDIEPQHRDVDTVVFEGKFYVPYPPAPGLMLAPFVSLGGAKTWVAYLFCGLMAAWSVFSLCSIMVRLGFSPVDRWWWGMAFFLGTGFWFCLAFSFSAAYNSHIVVCALLLAMIRECLDSAQGWLLGLLFSAAIATRPMTVFATPFVLTALWTVQGRPHSFRRFAAHFAAMTATATPLLAFSLWFNWARFHNPLEVGYGFTGFHPNYGLFSPAYLPRNLYYLFLQGFTLEFRGQDALCGIEPTRQGTSLLYASPFVLLAFFARWRAPLVVAAWASIIPCILAVGMCSFFGFLQLNCQRYAFDYLPLIFLLVLLGYQRQVRRRQTLFWKGLIAWSVGLNVLTLGLLPWGNWFLTEFVLFFRH